MSKRINAFAVSWFFAPYLGSADLDFFKRIKNCAIDFDVMQVRREKKDERVLSFGGAARIERHEVTTDHANPRTRRTRDDFRAAVLARFKQRREQYDVIVSHSNEVPSHAVALECKRLSPKTPWVAYFGDLISANPYVKFLSHYPLNDEDCETERRTIEHADIVLCNNEYQRDLMFVGPLKKFLHKAVVVPHCYDPAMYEPTQQPANARFRFVHTGTLYSVKRTAEPVLRAVDRLIEIYPAYEGRFELVFWGGGYAQSDRDTYEYMRNRSHVRLEGSVNYLESLRLMQGADVLLNIDGVFQKEDGLDVNPFFPGKLVDYMGARKPIFSVTMPRGATADVMRESANVIADTRPDRIAYVLKRYLDGRVKPDMSAFSRYDISVVSREMQAVFDAAVKGGSAISQLSDTLAAIRSAS